MGKLESAIEFTGRIGKTTFYRRRGSEKIIIRYARGVEGKRLKEEPAFENTRKANNEFKARNLLARAIYSQQRGILPVFDYNIYNELMSRTHIMQLQDMNDHGKRGLLSSVHGQCLEGLSFNKKFSLDQLITPSLEYDMDLASASASVRIPELIPGTHFHNLPKRPFYRIHALLQAVPDIVYEGAGFKKNFDPYSISAETPWHKSGQNFPASELVLQLPAKAVAPTCLMLSVSVLFDNGNNKPIRYVGAGKVLKVVRG